MAAIHNQRDDSDPLRVLSISRIVFYDQLERGTMQPIAGGVQRAVWRSAEIGVILLRMMTNRKSALLLAALGRIVLRRPAQLRNAAGFGRRNIRAMRR